MNFSLYLESLSFSLDAIMKDEFLNFCDSLMMYISYNDKESAEDLVKMIPIIKASGIIDKKKKVYKIIKSAEENITDIKKISSCSTVKLKGSMLEDMKEMVNDNNSEGTLWYCTYKNVEGIDINKLYSIFKGNKKMLIKKHDIKYNTVSSLYDAFDDFKKQKEFIVLGKGILEKYERI